MALAHAVPHFFCSRITPYLPMLARFAFRMGLCVHVPLQVASFSTGAIPLSGVFVLKSKHKDDKKVKWEDEAAVEKAWPQVAASTVPLVEFSMRYMWNAAQDASPIIDPSGEYIDMWVHNYGDMVLISVDEHHVEHLAEHWSDYGLDSSLGEVADCDWGYLASFDDQREE